MTDALILDNLSKTYGNGFEALKGVSLRVAQGDFYALLGPNGAGKSTTIGILCSLVNKTGGRAEIFGYDIETHLAEAKACIGLVPQEFNFNGFEKVEDILMNQAGFYGVPRRTACKRTEKYLKILGLWDKRHSTSRSLSGGMKRRLMIARALIHNPKMLILDEPTAGVDIELRRSMWQFLKDLNAEGTTIILTTHYLEEAEYLCRHVGIIDRGELIENASMASLLSTLCVETFVLTLKQPLTVSPDLPAFNVRLQDELTLVADINKQQSLNDLFEALSRLGIQISTLRNEANRLETLFLKLTGGQ